MATVQKYAHQVSIYIIRLSFSRSKFFGFYFALRISVHIHRDTYTCLPVRTHAFDNKRGQKLTFFASFFVFCVCSFLARLEFKLNTLTRMIEIRHRNRYIKSKSLQIHTIPIPVWLRIRHSIFRFKFSNNKKNTLTHTHQHANMKFICGLNFIMNQILPIISIVFPFLNYKIKKLKFKWFWIKYRCDEIKAKQQPITKCNLFSFFLWPNRKMKFYSWDFFFAENFAKYHIPCAHARAAHI